MSLLHDLLADVFAVSEYDLQRLEIWIAHRRRGHAFRPVAGRFAGVYATNPMTGETIVADQQILVNTAYTGALTFVDATGAIGLGPIGTVTASDPSVSVTLSADGQHYNVTGASEPVTATLAWHDPAGVVPDFTAEIEIIAGTPVFAPVSGSFGTLSEGTTA